MAGTTVINPTPLLTAIAHQCYLSSKSRKRITAVTNKEATSANSELTKN